jgi:signal transduction histidine kinase
VVANRSIVYGSMAAAISVIYAVVVAGIGGAVGGDRSNVFAAVAATAVAAVVFQPLRRRAQTFADRLIYGDRASPYQLLATFSERLDEASLHEVLPRMAGLVAEGTGAERVRIWLRNGTELRGVAAWPSDELPASPVRLEEGELPALDDPAFAVRHGGDLLGAITVGMPPQEPMTATTERLLADLSAQAGLVVRNVALVEELQRSRQRLVTSEDEARRRLERDLHDGAQQRLVTLSMGLRMARERAGASGDVELTKRLDAAGHELAQSLAELRELARGIHPAILTQNGLGGALRSLAERSGVPVELRSVPEGRY